MSKRGEKMLREAVDCTFCREESWYGKDHQESCPVKQNEELFERLVDYRRFLQELKRQAPGSRMAIAIGAFLRSQQP